MDEHYGWPSVGKWCLMFTFVTSPPPFSDEFHKEWTWVCLDIINEINAASRWHLIVYLLILKCVRSHHTHTNEKDIGVDD